MLHFDRLNAFILNYRLFCGFVFFSPKWIKYAITKASAEKVSLWKLRYACGMGCNSLALLTILILYIVFVNSLRSVMCWKLMDFLRIMQTKILSSLPGGFSLGTLHITVKYMKSRRFRCTFLSWYTKVEAGYNH